MTLEDTMIATLNFLYTTYTGEYEVNKESKLFEPLTELLQSYGNTFEDVLEVIKGIVTLIG
jgi:predicted house-cleaning noncanonical NTP pyrophosphatase (MazG superfamily)